MMIGFLWIFLYEAIHLAKEYLPATALTVLLFLYCAGLFYYLKKNGQAKAFGLCGCRLNRGDIIRLLPLCAFFVYNLFMAQFDRLQGQAMLCMLCICFVEELFFRGVFIKLLLPRGEFMAVFISSAAFALLHGLNGATQTMELTALQIISAFFVGICYGMIAIEYKSLLMGLLSHSCINIAGLYVTTYNGWGIGVCSGWYMLYAVILYRTRKKGK